MENSSKILSSNLAEILLNKTEKVQIITEIFNFFGFDCIARCHIQPVRLDGLIKDFEKSDYRDAEILTEIIEVIRNGKKSSFTEESALLEEIRKYVSANLTEDISVEKMAEKFNVSYYYICHFFKQQTNISITTFKNQKRVEKAAKLLTSTDKKVTDIAVECGFNNVSYFTEIFTKLLGVSPTEFKAKNKDICIHDFYSFEDILLASQMDSVKFLSKDLTEVSNKNVEIYSVSEPDDTFGFLHEAAIIEYKGVLYASWYNCSKEELKGYTPICERRSFDGGKSWTDLAIIAEDKTGKILYCPPVYAISDGKLYMLLNQMVAPDHIHSLDLYILDEKTDKFVMLWSRPIPFKLNTNVVALPNGKLMLSGRIAELDGFPNTPAVLISDSGKVDAEWRLVKISPNGDLPDGKSLVHPEISVICCENILYMFNRNDQRRVPFVYISKDFGESWSSALAHDIPYIASKVYCGTLADGRNYIIANTDRYDRTKLEIYFSQRGNMVFDKKLLVFDGFNNNIPELKDVQACHYPSAIESGGKLYLIATKNVNSWSRRGAELFIIDLKDI